MRFNNHFHNGHHGHYDDRECHSKRDMIYDAPRFTIGSDTRELIIPLGRTFETGFSTSELAISLIIKRRSCKVTTMFEWNPYAIKDGKAHFEIPDELVNNPTDFPRGMYDINVNIAGCTVGELEMIKAPSYFVRGVETRDSKVIAQLNQNG